MTETTTWYVATRGEKKGPLTFAALEELVQRGELVDTDLVWSDGMTDWCAASAVRGLFPGPPPLPPAVRQSAPLASGGTRRRDVDVQEYEIAVDREKAWSQERWMWLAIISVSTIFTLVAFALVVFSDRHDDKMLFLVMFWPLALFVSVFLFFARGTYWRTVRYVILKDVLHVIQPQVTKKIPLSRITDVSVQVFHGFHRVVVQTAGSSRPEAILGAVIDADAVAEILISKHDR